MAFFRKRDAQVIKKGSPDQVEVRKTRRIGGQKVEVRRVTETPAPPDNGKRQQQKKKPQGPVSGSAAPGSVLEVQSRHDSSPSSSP
jgi:hypothetical protein